MQLLDQDVTLVWQQEKLVSAETNYTVDMAKLPLPKPRQALLFNDNDESFASAVGERLARRFHVIRAKDLGKEELERILFHVDLVVLAASREWRRSDLLVALANDGMLSITPVTIIADGRGVGADLQREISGPPSLTAVPDVTIVALDDFDDGIDTGTISQRVDVGALPSDLRIIFDPSLSAEQIGATLTSLANYFRACGGVGMSAEFEDQEAVVEDVHV